MGRRVKRGMVSLCDANLLMYNFFQTRRSNGRESDESFYCETGKSEK